MASDLLDDTFEHHYSARILSIESPEPGRIYIPAAPRLHVEVVPTGGSAWTGVFGGESTGRYLDRLLTTPAAETVCVVANGSAYLVDSKEPTAWTTVECTPVRHSFAVSVHKILVFADFVSLVAYELDAGALEIRLKPRWRTERLGWDDLEILEVTQDRVYGRAWRAPDDRLVGFSVDLETGWHEGGAYE